MSNNGNKGSVLIAVLWSLFFLAALAVVINVSITPQLALASRLRDRTVLRYLAKAGVAKAIVTIREDETKKFDALNEPWSYSDENFKEIELTDTGYFSLEHLNQADEEEGEKRYGLIDEERKININTAPADILKQFFEVAARMSSQDASEVADAIVDWRDEDDEPLDDGAENAYYESLSNKYSCKNAPFDILEELKLVRGVTESLYGQIEDKITIYGDGAVNINTAGPEVLESLGMSAALVEKIISFRQGNDGQEGTEDDNVFETKGSITSKLSSEMGLSAEEIEEIQTAKSAGMVGVKSNYFRGGSFGRYKNEDLSVKIVFVINRDEQIQFWREY